MKHGFCVLSVLSLIAAWPVLGATKLIVTVTEQKTGRPVTDLKADDFEVLDDKTPRQVESVETASDLLDVMLLFDTSLVGEAVQPFAHDLITQLQPKEQMAVVSFASSADLIQDFTSSKELLSQAIAGVKYGNTPRVLDAIYASVESGFENSAFRRVVLLLTTGFEGGSRVNEKDVIRMARKNGVSIFPIYLARSGRWVFDDLARQTGGAFFRLGEMRREGSQQSGARIFEALRQHYVLTIAGNATPGQKLKIVVNRQDKPNASGLPLE